MAGASADEELTRDAGARLTSAPAFLRRHSLRMAVLADDVADREGLDVDRAGLFCACAFHDLGTLVPGGGPFPLRSALLLDAFLAGHGVEQARRAPLVSAVRGHLAPPGIPLQRARGYAGPATEVTLLRRVAWLDALGVGDRRSRRRRRELRDQDGDGALDIRLSRWLGVACALDALGAVRTRAAPSRHVG